MLPVYSNSSLYPFHSDKISFHNELMLKVSSIFFSTYVQGWSNKNCNSELPNVMGVSVSLALVVAAIVNELIVVLQ